MRSGNIPLAIISFSQSESFFGFIGLPPDMFSQDPIPSVSQSSVTFLPSPIQLAAVAIFMLVLTVLLTAPDVRRTLRKLCESAFPDVAVLTYGELDMNLQIRPLGRLSPVALGC